MRDIDKRLHADNAAPRRPLDASFTSNVIRGLRDGPRSRRRPTWKEYIQVRLHHKLALAVTAFVITTAAGGSAFAAVGGISGVRALFGSETAINDGERIVQVRTENCDHVNAFNITNKDRTPNDSYYYRIKKDSKLTNAQVVNLVQGYCEADAEAALNSKVAQSINDLPENKGKLVGGYADTVITAISPTSISIHYVFPYGYPDGTFENKSVDQTFTRVDPNVMVISNGKTESYSSLKVGDHVALIYRATGDALLHSETTPPDQIDASAQTVVIITRVSNSASDYFDYNKYNNKEFEQVAPCDKTDSGYCTLEQYQSK